MPARQSGRGCLPFVTLASARALASITAATLSSLAIPAHSLPDDRRQPIEIQSLEAIRDEGKAVTIYTGDVSITQGSIMIEADKVTVYSPNKKVSKIVCEGQPARYQQQPEPGSSLVIAEGNAIQYNLATDVILLLGSASLEQQEATLSGERIEYDLKQEVIRAKGGGDSGRERIRMVIPPSQQSEAE